MQLMNLMAQEITTDMAESAASQTEFYTVAVNQEEESPHEMLNTSETKDSFVADDREHSPVSSFKYSKCLKCNVLEKSEVGKI